METLDEVEKDVRTYSIPNTTRNISESAFYHNKVLKAVRLNTKMKDVNKNMFLNSSVQRIICPVAPEDVEKFLTQENQARTAILLNGVWLTTSTQSWGYSRQTTMVVPPDVREI